MNADDRKMMLTHYHHKDDAPFQTLSSLADEDALSVISNLRDRAGSVYRRFRDPEKYLKQRREAERWVRQAFISKGGQPISAYPHYFVVERAVWIKEGYNGQSRAVQFPVSVFQSEQVSFTYPDSMISYWLQSQTDQVFYRPEYHCQVFVLSEICEMIDAFGIPSEEWRTEAARRYDLFIEAQVWTNIP
ncbi:hypothetical protein [Microcoleus sp. herbarium2]|uniref:hypothetical protein n=1 Tax=Microcoleus sp. herbarium2 TaxID=3055433 RepID=UPI002FD0232B